MRYYNIANIKIMFDGIDAEDFEESFCSKLIEYETGRFDIADMNVKFTTDYRVDIPQGTEIACFNWRHWVKTDTGYFIYDTAPDTGETVLYIKADETWSNITIAFDYIERFAGAKNDLRLFNIMIEVLKQGILWHNGIIVHSSSIKYTDNDGNDYGLIFSAKSGTGKSTHTQLWQTLYGDRVKIINDDTPILKFESDGVMLCGMPWSGSTGINSNCITPLKAIVFIQRGTQNSIRPLTATEALPRLLSETAKSVFVQNLNRTLEAADKLIKNVDIYLLTCNISTDAVKTVQQELGIK